MSEAPDQPGVAEAPVAEVPAGIEAAAPETTSDDIETEHFDRMEAPDDGDTEAGDGQTEEASAEAAPAAEATEIEFEAEDGNKYKVPKALEKHLMLDGDYRQKTAAVAEQRRAVEAKETELAAQAVQQSESLKALRTEHMAIATQETALASIDEELASYRKYTPAAWEQTKADNPALFDQHADRLNYLRTMRTTVAEALEAAKTDLSTKETALTERQQAAVTANLAKAWGETSAVLAKKIEGWSPERGQQLADMAVKDFGASAEELQATTDPRIWIAFDEISRLRAENARLKTTSTQATATATALKSQAVTPAVKPAGGAPKPTGVSDKLPPEEWMRRRNAQVAKRGKG